MSQAFDVRRAEMIFQADLREPFFQLFEDGLVLSRQLHARLQPYGLTPADMKLDLVGTGNLADPNLTCYLFTYGVTARFRIQQTEVWCHDLLRVGRERLEGVTVSVLDVISKHLRDHPRTPLADPFRAYTLRLDLHGVLPGATSLDFVSEFLKGSPEGLGRRIGAGVVFYYGAEDTRISSSVALDLSQLEEKGLFLRVWVLWDATKVNVPLAELSAAYVQTVLDSLGLVWELT